MIKRLVVLRQIPTLPDLGLLVLRLVICGPLFLKHGTEKLFSFGPTLQHFADPQRVLDPLHIGVLPTLIIATIADGICSLLMIFGLATRWAALFAFGNLLVVWAVVDHFVTVKKGLNAGEPAWLYMGGCLAIFLLGAGRYSIDHWIEGSQNG